MIFRRCLSAIIDFCIVTLLAVFCVLSLNLAALLFPTIFNANGGLLDNLLNLPAPAILYFGFFARLPRGTVGMRMLHLILVSDTGKSIGVLRSLARSLVLWETLALGLNVGITYAFTRIFTFNGMTGFQLWFAVACIIFIPIFLVLTAFASGGTKCFHDVLFATYIKHEKAYTDKKYYSIAKCALWTLLIIAGLGLPIQSFRDVMANRFRPYSEFEGMRQKFAKIGRGVEKVVSFQHPGVVGFGFFENEATRDQKTTMTHSLEKGQYYLSAEVFVINREQASETELPKILWQWALANKPLIKGGHPVKLAYIIQTERGCLRVQYIRTFWFNYDAKTQMLTLEPEYSELYSPEIRNLIIKMPQLQYLNAEFKYWKIPFTFFSVVETTYAFIEEIFGLKTPLAEGL